MRFTEGILDRSFDERLEFLDKNTRSFDRIMTRTMNIVLALLVLVLLAPLMLFIAVLVFICNPGPVFFGHTRIGKGGGTFRCWKFRSMVVDADRRLEELLASDPEAQAEWASTHKLKNDPRINPVGRFLRKSSIDELPQLFNVLAGEMSLVGPRPIVKSEVHHYGRYFRNYCAVTPGITGLWQINGRNDVSYRRRVACDVTYARTRSWWFDLRLIAATVPALLLARGSY